MEMPSWARTRNDAGARHLTVRHLSESKILQSAATAARPSAANKS
jgi:hypothetical protein